MIHQLDPFTEPEEAANRRGPLRKIILGSTPVLPVIVTLCNGVAGFISIHYATKGGLGGLSSGHLSVAAWLIFAAMFFDAMDGRVARMTRQATDFGAQLDSLCDVISFGVAPAILMLHTVSRTREITEFEMFEAHPSLGKLVLAVAVIYACCAVLRLARFNVENAPDLLHHMGFRGLPSPAAAALVASVVLVFNWLLTLEHGRWLQITVGVALPAVTLAAALLMVSRFPYPHLANQFLSRRKPFSTIVVVVVLMAAGLMFLPTSLAVATMIFAAFGPVTAIYRRFRPAATDEAEDEDLP
ncbi:MAG TPA: CDP-diacylglycerol--serine O-phosphatidyltransferase [Phycisphaerae bacterium]|nr:CDP-diacylglycerol--serine O-phosphatidyltransferase [Phycisphaerae bacterium]